MDITLKRVPKLLLAQIYTRNALTHRLIGLVPQPKLDRPVFILGVPRSGTSVFCNHFGAHRELAHWSEAPTVWDPDHRNPETDHRWAATRATPGVIRRINNNFSFYTRVKGRKRFVNKHPRNALRAPFLRAGWPDCFIIHIERDPRAVTHSLMNEVRRERWRRRLPLGSFARPEGWREIDALTDDTEKYSRMVVATYETLLDDLAALRNENVFTVKYEDYAKDCRGVLCRAFEFCELNPDERAVESAPATLENRNYKWISQKSRAELETMNRVLTPLVIRMGYEPDAQWLDRALARKNQQEAPSPAETAA